MRKSASFKLSTHITLSLGTFWLKDKENDVEIIFISQCPSRPTTITSSTVFDFDIVFAATTATVVAVVDQSNSCTLIGRFCLTAVVLALAVMTLCFAIHGELAIV